MDTDHDSVCQEQELLKLFLEESDHLAPLRYPRVSGREGNPVVDDDKSAERSEGAASRSPLGAEEYGRLAAGEATAADGAGSRTAGTGITQSCPHNTCASTIIIV